MRPEIARHADMLPEDELAEDRQTLEIDQMVAHAGRGLHRGQNR